MNVVSFSVHITGKVQGVWFRQSTANTGQALGVSGFVKNMPDGSVYAEVSGEEMAVQTFLDYCRKGPELALVDQVIMHPIEVIHSKGFRVER